LSNIAENCEHNIDPGRFHPGIELKSDLSSHRLKRVTKSGLPDGIHFNTKNLNSCILSKPWKGKLWYILLPFAIFKTSLCIVLPFGTFCGDLVYFSHFGMLCQEKSGNPERKIKAGKKCLKN
jgi:hypothetical protein